ncbi:hypothetical protein D3C71_1765660 [compost metagenome]
MGHPAAQRCDNIVQRRSTERGNKADTARLQGQRALAGRVKKAFGVQLRLQPQELLEKSALPRALHAFDNELQIAARLIHPQAPPHLHQFAIARRKVKQSGCPAEHGATQLATGVLDRKIAMPAGCAREARDLAAHRHRVEPRLQRISNGAA